jgi:CheY-like chemotaxis protein
MCPTRRILVVDSCLDTLTSTAWLLRWWGHDVQAARDAQTALETVRTFRPDTILTEIALPGLDGFWLAERLRQPDAAPHALLIAITGYGGATYLRRSTAAGFDHHLVKPVAPAALEALLGSRPISASGGGRIRAHKPHGRAPRQGRSGQSGGTVPCPTAEPPPMLSTRSEAAHGGGEGVKGACSCPAR